MLSLADSGIGRADSTLASIEEASPETANTFSLSGLSKDKLNPELRDSRDQWIRIGKDHDGNVDSRCWKYAHREPTNQLLYPVVSNASGLNPDSIAPRSMDEVGDIRITTGTWLSTGQAFIRRDRWKEFHDDVGYPLPYAWTGALQGGVYGGVCRVLTSTKDRRIHNGFEQFSCMYIRTFQICY